MKEHICPQPMARMELDMMAFTDNSIVELACLSLKTVHA